MSPQPPALLDQLWESIPAGPAPVDDLVQRGRTRRRRRRLGLAGGALAVVVAAGAAISVVPRSDGHANGVLTPPAGTRYVGIGQVVVAVPEAWPFESGPCNRPLRTSVYFIYAADWVCPAPSRTDVSSVTISPVKLNNGFTGGMSPDGHVGGHRVVARPHPAMCMPGEGPEECLQSFGVPDLGAYFSVRIPRDEPDALDQVMAIRDSLTLLPDGQTTVPFVTPLSSLGQWEAALRDAGFIVRERHRDCPDNAFCAGGVIDTAPAAGSVVRTGSTVTVEVMDP